MSKVCARYGGAATASAASSPRRRSKPEIALSRRPATPVNWPIWSPGMGRKCAPSGSDVTDEEEGKAAVQTAVETFGRIDVLVNNAGYGDLRPFEQRRHPRISASWSKPACSASSTSRGRFSHSCAGSAADTSSRFPQSGGRMAFPANASYFAAKWGVGGFTEGVALEVAPFGIKVTALEPGGMRTNFVQDGQQGTARDMA